MVKFNDMSEILNYLKNHLNTSDFIAIFIGAFALYLAYKQIKISKIQAKNQLYLDNSKELITIINNINFQLDEEVKNNSSKIDYICDELDKQKSIARTYLSKEIAKYVENFTDIVKLVRYEYQNYIYGKDVISKLKSEPNQTIVWRKEVFYADGMPFYDYKNGVGIYTYSDIDNIEKYCLERFNSAKAHLSRIGTMTNQLNGEYNTYNINQKYKKHIK